MNHRKHIFFYILIICLAAANAALFLGYATAIQQQVPPSPPLGYISPWQSAENFNKKDLVIVSPISEFKVEPKEINSWFELYTRGYTGRQEYRINQDKIKTYLDGLSSKINRPPINARLVIEDGKAKEFAPPQNGFRINVEKSLGSILIAVVQEQNTSKSFAELAIEETSPGVTLEKLNALGINTLIGRGESNFVGSPTSRAHNISIGARIFTGIILKPGENFSFNNLLGPVDASTGYTPELVIKNGKLIPEYGGGLCQVSTTLFRAAVYAGLPITERRPHSLPVRYYNPQGFDATIYPGGADLKFTNDTASHILIQAKIIGSKIYFEIYGTPDGRQVAVDGPHQYDVQPSGALKAVIRRTVIYPNGTEKKDEFYSSYKSPSLFPTVRDPLE